MVIWSSIKVKTFPVASVNSRAFECLFRDVIAMYCTRYRATLCLSVRLCDTLTGSVETAKFIAELFYSTVSSPVYFSLNYEVITRALMMTLSDLQIPF